MSRRVLVASLAAFVVAVAGTVVLARAVVGGSEPRDDPAAFVTKIVGFIVADDYPSAWSSLYPAHQQIALENEYVDCELQRPVSSTLDSISVLRVRDRKLHIPGEAGRVEAKAVTLRIELENSIGAKESFRHTFNAVPNGSHWSWILTPSRYQLYRDDACGVT